MTEERCPYCDERRRMEIEYSGVLGPCPLHAPRVEDATHQQRVESWEAFFERLYKPVQRHERSEAADAAFNEALTAASELLATEGLVPRAVSASVKNGGLT